MSTNTTFFVITSPSGRNVHFNGLPLAWLNEMEEPNRRSVNGLLDNVGGEGVVAADADGVPGQDGLLFLMTARQQEVAERGKKNLPVVGRDQVVEDGVYGRAHVKEHVGDHVEVVVEIKQSTVEKRRRERKRK